MKINAILLNIKLNRPKLVSMCEYILAINGQNFMEIHLAKVKILQKVVGGGGTFFDSHCTYYISTQQYYQNQRNTSQITVPLSI